MKEIYVVKRDGTKELLNYDKINKVLLWATDGISNVFASDVAMNAQLQIYNNITTDEIHRVLIQSANDMISEEYPNYQYVAANLLNYLIRKQIFDTSTEMPHLLDVIKKNVEIGVYDKIILDNYSEDDIDKLNSYIKHKRDFTFTYAGIQQLVDKYLIKNRNTGELYETPQFMYMMIAMTLYTDAPDRLKSVKSYYNDISTFKSSLPTPVMAGVRTPNRQYSSCVLIDTGDSLESIYSSNTAVGYYTAKRAGIGLNIGRIRSIGDSIRGGEVVHTGVVPFLKMFESTVKSCTQNGIRGGCLKKDTLVKTVNYIKDGEIFFKNEKIQNISKGDYVLSFDIENEVNRVSEVLETHLPIVESERQIKFTISDGTTFTTSVEHPMCFFNKDTNNWEYKLSKLIEVNDIVKSINDENEVFINNIEIGLNEDEQFYDITVANDNNYYAGDEEDKMVVVHNSSTIYFPFWHKEVEEIIVLKNNKGTDDNRVRKLDYAIQFCRLFYKRFINNEEITLFSPNDVPDLMEAFGNNDLFEELYEKYERKTSINKKKVKARDLMNSVAQERIGTGRIYIMNIDHANDHSSFTDRISMSNLCVEINLVTNPINHISESERDNRVIKIKQENIHEIDNYINTHGDIYTVKDSTELLYKTNLFEVCLPDSSYNLGKENVDSKGYSYIPYNTERVYGEKPGEIALCVLSAVNLGEIKDLSEIEGIMMNIVRGLDYVITHQDYPVEAAKKMLKRRSLGVGITNLAYYLAKNDVSYEDAKALELVDEAMEYIQFYGIKASVELAKEYGPCEWFNKTKYAKGILPIDTYSKNVDKIVDRKYSLDWEWLRQEVLTHGMRNSTITAIMPVESSSVVSNSTNGMEPVRSLVTIKKSKQGLLKMVVPEISRLKNKYTLAFDMKDNKGITNIQSVIQKWIDQGISANHYYDFTKYDEGNLKISDVAKDLLYFYQMGGKQLYYANTNDNKTDNFDFMNKDKDNSEPDSNNNIPDIDDGDCAGGSCQL